MSRQLNPAGFILARVPNGWDWRIQGLNGSILCRSEPFKRRRGAVNSMESAWKCVHRMVAVKFYEQSLIGEVDPEIKHICDEAP